ncbi:MAG: phosphoribosylaminoimidazolesuccinocarboxamide synthase [Gemmatimonadales bacterium]|nr:MAG: phosphoribosylaminoimidazolesuccinocarboxamide synthase [Gemmatimonadales bacterium]
MSSPSPVPSGLGAPSLPLPLLHRGKVREMYEVDADHLLMVASDRVSAFDVVMGESVPRKGEVLTQLTAWWLDRLGPVLEADRGVRATHHVVAAHPDEIARRIPALDSERLRPQWERRALLVRRTRPLPVECVVRGYLSGSAWKEYREHGTLAGEPLPEALKESDPLDPPIFSPATKAQTGHDENIPFSGVVDRLGDERAENLRSLSLALYRFGSETARRRGILLADTKFEFGEDPAGRLVLIDEVLTPDSSRYWPLDGYVPGSTPPSLDKQPVRDYLAGIEGWDRSAPAPPLPDRVVTATTDRYLEIFRRLTGVSLDRYEAPGFPGGDR